MGSRPHKARVLVGNDVCGNRTAQVNPFGMHYPLFMGYGLWYWRCSFRRERRRQSTEIQRNR
jgi:hypothetical protein